MPQNRLIARVCLHTGLRVGDVVALRTQEIGQQFMVREAKTGKRRRVGLPENLQGLILSGGYPELHAARLAERRLPRREGPGRESVRLLSAVTPDGVLVYRNTVEALADEVIVLRDEYGAVSRVILDELRRQALERGLFVITCRCPMAPEDKIEHLLFPEVGLAVLTSNSWHPMTFHGQHNVRCSRFSDTEGLRARRHRMRFNQKAAAELLAQTSALQQEARAAHSELETYYKSAADFAQVDAMILAETARAMGLAANPIG